MQPERTVDDNANYAITNVSPSVPDTPSKTLKRSTSIKYVNDADDEPVYYNEAPTSYVEPPAAYFEPAPGTFMRHISRSDKDSTFTPTEKLFITSFPSCLISTSRENDKINQKTFPFLFDFISSSSLEQALDI